MSKLKNPFGNPTRKLKVVTLRLYEEDVEDAKDYFPTMGYNVVVRELFASYMTSARLRMKEVIENNAELRNISVGNDIDAFGGSAEIRGAAPVPEGTLRQEPTGAIRGGAKEDH